ncbi:MAG: hypothetical protein J2P44_05830, partial [Candidatus Dormibacteraeota bacterium]|nr:hypothetical protein [Candidatus Dormibacteraeota bacterium]
MATSATREAAGTREGPVSGSGLSPLLFAGIVVASIGGPLALVALQIPASSEIASRVPWVTLAGTVLFLAPIAVWYGYARRIASAGGLTAFVEAAAGRRVATAQGALWIVSYALYMVYTIPQVVYEMLPAAVSIPTWAQPALAIGMAVAVGGTALLPLRWAVSLAALVAVAQILLVLMLAGVVLPHPARALSASPAFGAASLATAQASLFYVCGSLPLFLSSEVEGGARGASRGLLVGFAVAAVVVLVGVAAVARAGIQGDSVAIPGQHLASGLGAPGLGLAVGVGASVSTAVVVLAEFLAMSRLVHHLFVWPVRRVTLVMAAALVAGTAVTLVNPIGIYEALLKPSLIALWLSQVIVFAVYPLYRARMEPGRRGGSLA